MRYRLTAIFVLMFLAGILAMVWNNAYEETLINLKVSFDNETRKWTYDDTVLFVDHGRVLPSVIKLGASKCGSTTLTSQMQKYIKGLSYGNPQIGATLEHHYFSTQKTRNKYVQEFDMFAGKGKIQRSFDGTPAYGNVLTSNGNQPQTDVTSFRRFYSSNQMKRVQFIISVCDPIQRYYSALNHQALYGDPNDYLEKIIHNRTEDILGAIPRGHYGKTVQAFVNEFPENEILIVESSYFYKHQKQVLRGIADFLGLPFNESRFESVVLNRKQHLASELTPLSKANLKKLYNRTAQNLKKVIDSNDRVYSIPNSKRIMDSIIV